MRATTADRPLAIDPALLQRRVSELPALPQVALQVLAILRDETARTERCGEVIAQDQALTARTLRLANSAFYGVPGRVGTIRDAVHLLGRRTLGALLTVATVSAQFSATSCAGFDFGAFWRHSIGAALAARALARGLQLDEDLAFTAGLVHDIGRLALATHFPLEMSAAIEQALGTDTDLHTSERAVLAIDHADVGALIARHWHFPPEVVHAIGQHHRPDAAGTQPTLTDIVHLADAITHALDLARVENESVPAIDLLAWDRLALRPDRILAVFEQTEAGVAELCDALGL